MSIAMRKANVVDFGRHKETKKQVLERLFREHGSALRAFLRVRMVLANNDSDYEDLEQDVFIRLARMDDLEQRLPVDGEANRSFIIKVANNLILDLERQRKVRSDYLECHGQELKDADVIEVTPEMEAQSECELEQAKGVLMAMRPRWRDAFILHRFGNKTYVEIAGSMGVSTKQIEKYISQAVKCLREAAPYIRGMK